MKKFYLVGTIVTFVLILIASFAQLGATCTWYLFSNTAPAFMVLLQVAGLGAVTGGLFVLFWKFPKEETDEDEDA